MRKILITYSLLLFCVFAYAQATVATDMPYECSFEPGDSTLSAWVLNQGTPTATDKWIIGTAVHSEGRRSMYITTDGVSPVYGRSKNIVVSYLRYKFPSAGSYDISFDWRGVGDSAQSKLYMMLCPESQLTTAGTPYYLADIVSTTTGRLNNSALGVCQQLGTSKKQYLCGSETWQNVTLSNGFSVNASRSTWTWALVFIWVNDNNNQNDTIRRSGIAIDNVQINSAALKKPYDVEAIPQCEDSTMLVTWHSGSAREYDIEYRKMGELSWSREYGLTDGEERFERNGEVCSYTLTRILEGSWEVRVRGVSWDGTDATRTSWVYKTQILVYCPENHCINYIDLYDTARVTCTYGYYPGYLYGPYPNPTPYDSVKILDYGPDAKESRHTLHVDPTERDPRTGDSLHTVPPGALASVRLGNWDINGEAESITYDILVDSFYQGILIIKYAVVLENPSHPGDPEFMLEILDQNGNLIDPTCGQAHFTYSDAVDAGWNVCTIPDPNWSGGTTEVAWKDWTTIGVPLMAYHGQNIKVRFTTMDCDAGGHFGYAYFTVDCANAHIETNNCGSDAAISCIAPEGFKYYWYNELGDSVGNERELIVDAGMHTYTCRVSFIEEPTCGFEISTLSAPRFPVPEYTVMHTPYDCNNVIKFNNTSHVMTKYDGQETHTSEPCQAFDWRFRRFSDGQTLLSSSRNPTQTFPNEGDTVEVTFTCYIGADNACDSTRIDTIVVPSIISKTTEFRYQTCPEQPISFDGEWFNQDTVYRAVYSNFAGCDSVSILYLDVYSEAGSTYRHDSICDDQSVIINGVKYNQPMDDYLIMLRTVHDCDSAIYLTLTVNERIKQSLDTVPYACADEQNLYIPLMIDKGVFDSLAISFSTLELRDTVIYTNVGEVNIPYSANITPGSYTATFTYYQFCCGTHTFTRTIDVRYRSSIVEQKWNDVLTLLSPKYNGGYRFTAFQWYKNDEPLEGETNSYLYQPLDVNATYYVEVTREDGVTMTTCPIQPEHHEDQTPFPTIVPAGKRVPMFMAHPATIWYYTMSGQLYSTYDMQQGYTDLVVPTQTGVYIIKSVNSQGETKAQTMIVE